MKVPARRPRRSAMEISKSIFIIRKEGIIIVRRIATINLIGVIDTLYLE